MVATRLSVEGTHMGDVMAPATGRKVKFAGIVMARISNGKITEAWNNLDQLGMLKQIGASQASAWASRPRVQFGHSRSRQGGARAVETEEPRRSRGRACRRERRVVLHQLRRPG
jgi:hypothetical protein